MLHVQKISVPNLIEKLLKVKFESIKLIFFRDPGVQNLSQVSYFFSYNAVVEDQYQSNVTGPHLAKDKYCTQLSFQKNPSVKNRLTIFVAYLSLMLNIFITGVFTPKSDAKIKACECEALTLAKIQSSRKQKVCHFC